MNLLEMPKKDLIDRVRFRCVHRHNGIEHPTCFDKRLGRGPERRGFADIETDNLNANFGYILTYCIKPEGGRVIKRCVEISDIERGVFDKNLCKQFIEDAKQFDRLIWHYGGFNRSFDIPYIRTRSVYWGLPFPHYGELLCSDTYPILKNKFKIHSNRLEAACQFFGIPAKNHPLNPNIWELVKTGNRTKRKRALDYILKHNVEDVESLEQLWDKISPFVRIGKTSA